MRRRVAALKARRCPRTQVSFVIFAISVVSSLASETGRYNIRVHSCVFVVNIRRWLRLMTGE